MDIARDRYSGSERKLIVALDIGTTFSGAAYAFLDPGEIPRIQSVTRHVFLRLSMSSTSDTRQVSEQSEPWISKSPFHIVLRPRWHVSRR